MPKGGTGSGHGSPGKGNPQGPRNGGGKKGGK
jgi:hypothetical protein